MRASYKSLAFRELDRLFRCGTAPLGDGALVGRFVAERNEPAFEALVARHGPMVLGVCRRLLRSAHDADDAFQATFLVLAQNAARVRDPDRIGPWLYGVATRVATKARVRAGRHRHEPLSEAYARDERSAEWSDVLPIVDAELCRLPAKHREVLVLCLLQGATAEEASRELGCPVGTVKSRLARGREALRARLTGRGIAPDLAGVFVSEAMSSPVPATLTRATLEAIAGSKVAPGVVALTKGAVPIMLSKSTVAAAVIMGGIVLAGAGTAAWMQTSEAQEPGQGAQDISGPEKTTTNMKHVLLAFHNFGAANIRLPASANYGADALPKLSWRVALLPYLDQGELYSQFRQDEPWDSPQNKALIARMPAVFETPGVPAPPGETRIRGFVGKGAIFEGTQGINFPTDITDGTSNTLMIAVARESTPWTRPGELPFVLGEPLPALDDSDPLGYWLGMCDGSVRALPKDEAKMLTSLITRAGGEVIIWPGSHEATGTVLRQVPTSAPTALAMPGPTLPAGGISNMLATSATPAPYGVKTTTIATSPEAIERRLAVVESKLDLVIRKLDAALRNAAAR